MVTKLCTPSHFASDVDTITICWREREPISGWYEDVNGKNATCSLPVSSLYWTDRQTYDDKNPRRELYLAITEELYLAETRASSRKLPETRVSQTEELTLKDENLIAKTRWLLDREDETRTLSKNTRTLSRNYGRTCLTMGRGILSQACAGRVNEETENITDNISKITDNISLLGCACNFNLQMKLLLLS